MHAAARLRDAHGNAATISPNISRKATFVFSPPDHVDTILQAVRQQIDQWGQSTQWKIDLALHELSPSHNESSATLATSPYPWNYVGPSTRESLSRPLTAGRTRNQRDADDRQHPLEALGLSQAEKAHHPQDVGGDSESMQPMSFFSENEKNQRYIAEIEMLRKDIETLSSKLKRTSLTLQAVEKMKLPLEEEMMDKEALLEDRRLLMRKLHLAELRLTARDAELDYLHETLRSYGTHAHERLQITRRPATPQMPLRKGPPYLFQQHYSPKMHGDVKPSSSQYMSGLESLGILADQMLSNPDFEKDTQEPKTSTTKRHDSPALDMRESIRTSPPPLPGQDDTLPGRFDTTNTTRDLRRSQRSIDLANALLSMPVMVHSPQREDTTDQVSRPGLTRAYDGERDRQRSMKRNRSAFSPEEDECFHEVQGVHGANRRVRAAGDTERHRWVNHNLFLAEEEAQSMGGPKCVDARHSPSIAALLNASDDSKQHRDAFNAIHRTPSPYSASNRDRHASPYPSHHSLLSQSTPRYSPPSPIATPTQRNQSNVSSRPM